MAFFQAKYPGILKILYPKRISKFKESKSIYFTFDDGPIPEVTPWVLNQLQQFNAQATFFCIGENIEKHPEIFQQIVYANHAIGNHTFNHLNGWKTSTSAYIENTQKAEKIISEKIQISGDILNSNYKLFRPPYGKITSRQARALSGQGYLIVMWDVISGDYNARFSAEKCFNHIIDHAVEGSILVFHDSEKAFPTLKKILPKILAYYSAKGFTFKKLTDAPLTGQ